MLRDRSSAPGPCGSQPAPARQVGQREAIQGSIHDDVPAAGPGHRAPAEALLEEADPGPGMVGWRAGRRDAPQVVTVARRERGRSRIIAICSAYQA